MLIINEILGMLYYVIGSLLMNSIKIVRKIQYQTAKLEVIEFMFWHGKNNQPSLEADIAHNMICTLRQNLFNASESYLDASLDTLHSYVASLQETLISAINFLVQMNSGLTSTEVEFIFLKELFTNIISELVNLNIELSNSPTESFQNYSNANPINISQFVSLGCQEDLFTSQDPDSTISSVDRQFKNLLSKCMGDSEKVERLINYESQRNSTLDKEGAILSAITRWERDNR
jgi:hypothetical protein